MSGFAWVTLATNDSYSLGALVLAHSLRQVGTAHQLAVLVTPGVTNSMRQKLSAVFNVVQEVNILDSKDEQNLRILKRPELGITFTKLHCWRLTQFEKCIFMDADTLVLVNSDELFEREEFSAAPDVGWPDCFNTGVFVYRPSNETYNKLVDFAMQKGSFDGGDQGLLNLYFSDWAHKDISKHLPFIYNMCSTACYSYMPAFKQYGADVKIVHFVGPAKPWLQYFDTQTRKVQPSSDLQHMQVILQRWWDIFCSLIHPNLSPDMSGLAGAFAQLTMGVKRTPSQDALENHLRRQAWEVGNVDYMGRDSFDNIWSKICDTLAAASVEKPVEEKSMEQTSSDSTIQEKPVLSVVEPTSKEVTASTTEEFVPQGTPQPENLKEIDVSSLEAKSDISQESKPESTTELSVKTITEVAKETVPEPLMGVKPDESFKPEIPQEDLEIKPTSQPTAATTELKPEAPASEAKSQESVVTEIPKLEETVVETSKGEEKGKVLEPTSSEIPKREETVTETPKSEEKAKEQEPLSSEIHKLEETAIETTKSEEKAKEPEPLSSEIHKLDETVIETPKGEEKDKLQEPTSIETKDVTEIKDQEQLTVAEASKQDESVKSDSKAELSKTEKSPIIVEAVDISKTEDSIKEVPKVIETPKTEPSKTIEPAKLEETVKVEEVSVIDEKPKAEELPKVEELSKVVEESLTKDAKTEETMKTVEVEMGKEEVPKVEETTKLDVSSPEVALKLISPVVESVQEAQETSKLVHKPEPEEAVSQVETQKPEEGKLEVLTEPDKPLKQAPKTEEISKDSSKIKETPKQSPKVEEPLKECPKVEESPKTEETPKVESKEPTKVKKVTKEGKEKKVKKVPKSEVKAEGLQEESVVPEGETSTSQSTETPTPPPRKTASGTKKVKAKKPNP